MVVDTTVLLPSRSGWSKKVGLAVWPVWPVWLPSRSGWSKKVGLVVWLLVVELVV